MLLARQHVLLTPLPEQQFQSQAINTHQERLDYEKYSKYLNTAADDLADATQAAAVDRTMHAQ